MASPADMGPGCDAPSGVSGEARLVACHHCDALQRLPAVPPETDVQCHLCGTRLVSGSVLSVDGPVALALTAAVLWILANVLPVLELMVEGRQGEATLLGSGLALWESGRVVAGAMTITTSVVFPGALILAVGYAGLAARLGRPLPLARPLLRIAGALEPWGMLDVFLLAVLVAAVKLEDLAQVIVGPGLAAYVGLVLVTAALAMRFDTRCLWERIDR